MADPPVVSSVPGHVDIGPGVSEIVSRAGRRRRVRRRSRRSPRRRPGTHVSAAPSWIRTSTGVRTEPPSGPTAWTHSETSGETSGRKVDGHRSKAIRRVDDDLRSRRADGVRSIRRDRRRSRRACPPDTTDRTPRSGGPVSRRYSTTVRGANAPRRQLTIANATIAVPTMRAARRSSGESQIQNPNDTTPNRKMPPMTTATTGQPSGPIIRPGSRSPRRRAATQQEHREDPAQQGQGQGPDQVQWLGERDRAARRAAPRRRRR